MLFNTEGFIHYELAVPKQALYLKFWNIFVEEIRSLVIQMDLES
jgi:hypothetical protein